MELKFRVRCLVDLVIDFGCMRVDLESYLGSYCGLDYLVSYYWTFFAHAHGEFQLMVDWCLQISLDCLWIPSRTKFHALLGSKLV